MSKPLPSRFDPDLMARDGTRYEAIVPLAQFKRLDPMLASTEGDVHASAVFSRRKDHVVVSGRLVVGYPLECQRCLEKFTLPVDAGYELIFADSEAEAQQLPDSLDPVIVDENGQIHVVDLFEDELILHVPLVARHEEGGCVATPSSFGGIAPEATEPAEPGEEKRQRPFEVLKNLDLH